MTLALDEPPYSPTGSYYFRLQLSDNDGIRGGNVRGASIREEGILALVAAVAKVRCLRCLSDMHTCMDVDMLRSYLHPDAIVAR